MQPSRFLVGRVKSLFPSGQFDFSFLPTVLVRLSTPPRALCVHSTLPPLLISSSLSSLFLMLSGLFRLSATSAGDLSPFRSPDAATTGHFGTRVRGLFFAYLRFGDATSRIFSTSLTKQSRTVHVWGNANTTPSEQRLHNNAAIFCASRQKCNCYRAGMPA